MHNKLAVTTAQHILVLVFLTGFCCVQYVTITGEEPGNHWGYHNLPRETPNQSFCPSNGNIVPLVPVVNKPFHETLFPTSYWHFHSCFSFTEYNTYTSFPFLFHFDWWLSLVPIINISFPDIHWLGEGLTLHSRFTHRQNALHPVNYFSYCWSRKLSVV